MKPCTFYNYTQAMKGAFPDWQTKLPHEITIDLTPFLVLLPKHWMSVAAPVYAVLAWKPAF